MLEKTFIVTRVKVDPTFIAPFAKWQADLNMHISEFPGFVSLEILSQAEGQQDVWVIVQRFTSSSTVRAWSLSEERFRLLNEVKKFLDRKTANAFQDEVPNAFNPQSAVTEVIVTQVSPEKELIFRKWIAKIHQIEAVFPGFRGVYVQAPAKGHSENWITLLQFDSIKNLDHWLTSEKRQEILKESESIIKSLETHRVISPYAGWFTSIYKGEEAPAAWKQTMIVLLVLFPIVMLEMKFLSPLTAGLNFSLGMFIGNAISVSLVSWPLVPICIYYLGWWLSPQIDNRFKINLWGTVIITLLYLFEIIIFWKLI